MIKEFTRKRGFHGCTVLALATVISVFAQPAAPVYDLLLHGGHVLRVEDGKFGFTDMVNRRLDGKQKLICELTIKDGKIVYDLNGISAELWTASPGPHDAEAYKWTTFAPRPHHAATPATEMPH